MIRRALPAVLGFLSLCLPLAAQQTNRLEQTDDETITLDQLGLAGAADTTAVPSVYRPDIFRAANGSVLIQDLSTLTLSDGRRILASSALGRMGMTPLDLFPIAFLSSVEVEKVAPSPMHGTDSPSGVVNMRLNRDYYAGGEVGVFYGKSTGKFSREEKQAYILGDVGDDKFHITVGAEYEESSWRVPRLGR